MATANNTDDRPDPDALLARARRDEQASVRGKLRIYFGASAGVGKTYAMLVAGRRLANEGCDVVVGIVETHGRRETAALLGGDASAGAALEVIPTWTPNTDFGEGTRFSEFDLDATLARKPQLVLVDELAHSNVAGARHPKRWQDVDELLTAGIDVFTTLNVQHLESLNDIVGGITGIKVWETVPDTFFDRADEVMLVDIPADELLKRLSAGKVYLPEQAAHAARNFFRKGNLIALREIALRRTADRVEDDVQAYREERSIEKVWATEAALLCCIGPDEGAERVVRSAARLAGQIDVAWHAIYVETPRLQKRSRAQREAILKVVKLAEQLGATTAVLSGDDVADVVARYARERNLSRLVIGHTRTPGIVGQLLGTIALPEGIATHAPELDLIVIGRSSARQLDDRAVESATTITDIDAHDIDNDALSRRKRIEVRLRYLWAGLSCAAVTLIAFPLWAVLHPTNIAMIYLLAVTLVAMRFGRGPAVFASFVAVAAFDFFFVPPRFSFAVSDVQYLVTFGVMLTVALVIGSLAANLRYQARVAAHREDRARSLYEIARDLSKAMRTEDVVEQARNVIANLFDAQVQVLLPMRAVEGVIAHDQLDIDDALGRSAGFEPAIAQWAYRQSLPAGAGTDTLSGSPWLFLPLQTPMRARGVLAIRPSRRRVLMIPEQRRLLETLAALLAIAIERVHYVEVAQSAELRIESERLRNSILSALSHDLRTPIAAIAGLAETLELRKGFDVSSKDADEQHGLIVALRGEVRAVSTMVENLLDMARIESGDVKLNRQWHSIEETVGTALAASRRQLAGHKVETALPRDLPLVQYDAVLLERVLVNLLENAAKYTPVGSTVRIEARGEPVAMRLAIEDDGPGLPTSYDTPQRVESLFEKFTRGVRESPETGVGLGLAICRAIVEAHDGTIVVEPRAPNGVRFVITLPRGEAPVLDEEPSTPATTDVVKT
jgi:two-component system, OmpR family, sensor histidine kinase KdpD